MARAAVPPVLCFCFGPFPNKPFTCSARVCLSCSPCSANSYSLRRATRQNKYGIENLKDLKEKLPADEAQKIFRAIESFSAAPSSSSAKGPARPAAVTTDAEGRARFQVSKAASGKGKKGPEAAAAAPASAPTEAKEGVVTTDAEGRARFRAAEA
ncbi:unnamed protein product, partial [Prorocentrum cordatum]